ncbi:MAG: menaquinone biosynthesis decarboxylase [Clostridiales bacterium]|nr:menaquinone biosynthesis decarboxylase [Clostridiales bacterium]
MDLALRDIREFLSLLEKEGELKRIREPVDPYLEMSAFAEEALRRGGPALLFEKPHPGHLAKRGVSPDPVAVEVRKPQPRVVPLPPYGARASEVPVAMNLFGSERRIGLALGVSDLEEAAGRVRELLELIKGPGPGGGSLLSKLSLLPKIQELATIAPRLVKSGPVQEVVEEGDEVNLWNYPHIVAWPGDGGAFITLALVITKDPETGQRNAGIYRMQILGPKTTAMHWELHHGGAAHFRKAQKMGKRLEVAAVIGADPVTIYAGSAPLPEGMDEFLFAGYLRRQAVELVRGKTVDLEVPAHGELVLEGYVDPSEELVWEGPFGDHTGFYSLPDLYPVFHVTAITRRRDPIYLSTIVGPPPKEDYFLGHITERLFLPIVQMAIPEVVDYHMPAYGTFQNLIFVAIKKSFPGHAYKVAAGLWGLGQMSLEKVIVVVDDDVNVKDPEEAWWVALSHMDPQRDVKIYPGPLSVLDHSPSELAFGGKMVIDGTRKFPEEGHRRPWPARIRQDARVAELVKRRWQELGLP